MNWSDNYTQRKIARDQMYGVKLPKIQCCYNCAFCEESINSGNLFCGKVRESVKDEIFFKMISNEQLLKECCSDFSLAEQDDFLRYKFDAFEDTTMYEDKDGKLRLTSNWWVFSKHTTRTDIWQYFDELHSKGIAYLLHNVA